MANFDFDLFVIGAGSGGARAARVAAQMGAKVAIAEDDRFGGTCVIRGCVPKKLFVYASHYRDLLEDAAGYGWSIGTPHFDWPTLIANKDAEIDRLSGIYRANLERAGVTLFTERAVLEDAHTVRLTGSNAMRRARTILVATGGAPFVPDLPGREHAITSNEAFHLPQLPKDIIIIGGGYIAVEFACIFHGLGVTVTVLHRGDHLLRGFDDDLVQHLQTTMQEKGIHIRLNAEVSGIAPRGSGFAVSLRSGETLTTELVMAATGRKPRTAGLGLERAGVALGPNGEVIVDAYSRSSVPNVYAIGDVTNRMNLTPVAIREAMAFAQTVFGDTPTAMDYAHVPTAVFSQPEIGTVGLSEAEARRHGEVDIYKTVFRPMKYALPRRNERMLMKLVVAAASGRVLGCHIIGPDAAEMVQIAAIPIKMGATKADFDATVALHPSAAEELVTMRERWRPPEAKAAE